MSSLSLLCRIYLGLVAFSLAGSLLSRLTGLSPGPVAPVASAATLATGFAALFEPVWIRKEESGLPALALALALACGVELIGLFTGIPFGPYEYTTRWQPLVWVMGKPFPVLLPFAWLAMVGASIVLCSKLRYAVVFGALLATAVDLAMEPIMTGPLGYWRWLTRGPLPGGASLLNPAGWFLTSCAVGLILTRARLDNRVAAAVVLGGHLILTCGIGAIASIPR